MLTLNINYNGFLKYSKDIIRSASEISRMVSCQNKIEAALVASQVLIDGACVPRNVRFQFRRKFDIALQTQASSLAKHVVPRT